MRRSPCQACRRSPSSAEQGGLGSASVALAGHLPPSGIERSDRRQDRRRCEGVPCRKGVSPRPRAIVFVRAGADGVEKRLVVLQMASGGDGSRTGRAEQFKATSARSKRPLLRQRAFRQVRMRAPGMGVVSVDLPRATAAGGRGGRAAAATAPWWRREGQLRSVHLLRHRRRACRLRQQPDSRSRRRPSAPTAAAPAASSISARASARIDQRVAADRQDRESITAPDGSRCWSSSACIRSSSR